MFDFHLHLARLPQPTEIGAALLQAGCEYNNVACEPWEWEKSLEIKEQLHLQSHLQAFGVHPMAATQVTAADLDRLEQILRSDNYPVGECGLDKRFEGYEPAGIQELVFKRQIELSRELNRPLQIHCVGDYFRILKLIVNAEQIPQVIFHRFGGDTSFVRAALKQLGSRAIFSLHADSFRKKSAAAAIKEIPPAQVRFETDADESFKIANQGKDVASPEAPIIAEAILHQLSLVKTKFF